MSGLLSRSTATVVFFSFAFAYFFSTLVRAITATISPTLGTEFDLQARDLGLLAGGYFLGFSLTQLPLGTWLDRYGPKRVILAFLAVAVAGCIAFSHATSFGGLLAARVLTGIGVSACLMAPLTGYRRWFTPELQLRSNSWMLMTGSLGTVASTLPVQWLMPHTGWRPLFWGQAALLVLAIVIIAWKVPRWDGAAQSVVVPAGESPVPVLVAPFWSGLVTGYGEVWRSAYFRKMAPLGFFTYGGLLAVQTLWAGPWLVKISGYTPIAAATGLFWLNVSMLLTYWVWGLANPWIARRGLHANTIIACGVPISFVVLAVILLLGERAGAAYWTLFCISCTCASLSQPAVGMAFPQAIAGRALSAFNLVIFSGVFVVQWGIGLAIDAFAAAGLSPLDAFRSALALFLACSIGAWVWFLLHPPHNRAS